jgi:hypothetical protein
MDKTGREAVAVFEEIGKLIIHGIDAAGIGNSGF